MMEYLALKSAGMTKTGDRIRRRAAAPIRPVEPEAASPAEAVPPLSEQAATVAPVLHRIAESFLDDRTQTVRCACGIGQTFARERNYYGEVIRPRALTEFVCTGQAVTLRLAVIRAVEG